MSMSTGQSFAREHIRKRNGRTAIGVIGAGLVTLSLLLAGCSGDSKQSGSTNGANSSGLSWEDSPLNAIYSEMYGGGDEDETDWELQAKEQNQKFEEIVAQCMADEGFEYTPYTGNFAVSAATDDDDSYQLQLDDPVAYAEKYGYGMYTYNEVPTPAETEETTDPNMERYDKMSESEQTAYNKAMNGDLTDMTETDWENYESDWTKEGCQGKASHEVYQNDEDDATSKVLEDPQFTEIQTQMSELYEKAENSDDMKQLNSKWADCMADGGYSDIKTPNDVWDTIDKKYQEFVGEDYSQEISDSQMDSLKQEEIKMATVDAKCKVSMEYDKKSMEVQFKIEQEFIDANKAQIDEFIAALQTAKKA